MADNVEPLILHVAVLSLLGIDLVLLLVVEFANVLHFLLVA